MHHVRQTNFSLENGNCFQACLASLFERPLEEIPHFLEDPANLDWGRDFHRWLSGQDLFAVECRLDEPPACLVLPEYQSCIITGPSPRNPAKLHSVVGLTGLFGAAELELVHDPHPDQNFFAGLPPKWIMFIAKRTLGT